MLFLSDGQITEVGAPEELFSHPQTARLHDFLSHTL